MDLPTTSLDTVLEIDLVMKEIGSYLCSKDLGNCRIASKNLYGAITPFYRATAVVTNVDEYMKRLEEGDTDLEEIPFRQFEFSGKNTTIMWNESRVVQFWKKCASVMTYIKLVGITKFARKRNQIYIKFVKKTCKDAAAGFNAPKLTTLILDEVDFKCSNLLLKLLFNDGSVNGENLKKLTIKNSLHLKNFPTTELIKLVLRYPTIEALSLHNVSVPYNTEFTMDFENMLTSLYEVRRKDFKSFNLKSLDILMGGDVSKINQETFKLLKTLRFPLESLTIDIGSTNVNEVTRFLSDYHGTLKKLELFTGYYPISKDIIDEFNFQVEFNALKILRISAFNSLAYVQFMPNLEFLHVYSTREKKRFELGGFSRGKAWRRTMKSITEGTGNLKLNFLREFRYDFQIEPEEVSYLAKLMPNLKSLTLVNLDKKNQLFNLELFSGLAGLRELILLKKIKRSLFFKNVQKMKNLDRLAAIPVAVVKVHNDDNSSFDDESYIDVESSNDGESSNDESDPSVDSVDISEDDY